MTAARPPRPRPAYRGSAAAGGAIRGRFTLTELPGVTVAGGPGRGARRRNRTAAAAAARTLARAGRGQYGGRLELRVTGPPPRPAAVVRAARRAVTAALRHPPAP
ncbi:hypothetical protein [Streptomyces sp. NPDC046887]|uniref:hypothetical protein n=1 Tax=Streptomyces sp. NPDC046887 TaxID=3155472 RepID=UPI0033D31416